MPAISAGSALEDAFLELRQKYTNNSKSLVLSTGPVNDGGTWPVKGIAVRASGSLLEDVPANSHQISQSFSNWTVEEKNITAVFSVAPRYITLLPVLDGYYDSLEDQLSNHLKKTQ